MSLDWLTVCAEGQSGICTPAIQLAYLAGVIVGLVVLVFIAVRSRDFSTATIALIPVAIAINLAMGALIYALRLPIYLDSVGTVLVGALAGPWAGALTGILANLIWSTLPVPGGAGPTAAFFAPVAGVIGLMAGFWAARGVFRLRTDDSRVGQFLALAAGVAGAGVALLVVQNTIGLPELFPEDEAQAIANQAQFVLIGSGIVVVGVVVAWLADRTVFHFQAQDARVRTYLSTATAIATFVLVFVVLRLLFSPNGYFSTVTGLTEDGTPDPFLGGANLSGLALPDDAGLVAVAVVALVVAAGAWAWARRGENARYFPVWIGGLTTGLVAAAISAPIAAGVYGGVTGGGTDALVALFRTLGLNVFQSAFAQGLTSDPLDKTISYTVVFLILGALPLTLRTMFSRGEATVADRP
jgi:hypothetical protein